MSVSTPERGAPERVDLPVSGMTCAACARTIERTLSHTAGVTRAQVNLATNTATVEFDPASVPVTVWGIPPDYDRLRRYEDQGVARGVVQLAAEKADTILPILDRWAGLIRQLRA